jgi:hypothetical protein
MNEQVDKLDFILSKLKEIELHDGREEWHQPPYAILLYDDYSGQIVDYNGSFVIDFEDYAELINKFNQYTKEK